MLPECGDRRFDLSHRMLVAGLVDVAASSPDAWIDAGIDVLVVRSSSTALAVCDRVDVPVGVESSPGQVEFAGGTSVSAVGPVAVLGAARIGRIAAAVTAGARVLLVADPASVRSDRRVVEVMARLLAVRAELSPEARP